MASSFSFPSTATNGMVDIDIGRPSLAFPMEGNGIFWKFDWFWGLPLLVITVVFHVVMFVLMEKTLVIKVGREEDTRTLSHFIVAMALLISQ